MGRNRGCLQSIRFPTSSPAHMTFPGCCSEEYSVFLWFRLAAPSSWFLVVPGGTEVAGGGRKPPAVEAPGLLGTEPPVAPLRGSLLGVQWVQGEQPSWFSEFSAAGGCRAGSSGRSLISITSRRCSDALLLSSSSSVLPLLYSLSTQHSPFIAPPPVSAYVSPFIFFLSSAFLQPCALAQGGFVMNGILLHIRRKRTLRRGFTNALHCPGNDSLRCSEWQPARPSEGPTAVQTGGSSQINSPQKQPDTNPASAHRGPAASREAAASCSVPNGGGRRPSATC